MVGRNEKTNWKLSYTMILLAVSVAIAASGCASKGYVNKRIDPVGQRVGTLETASTMRVQRANSPSSRCRPALVRS